MLSVLIPTYNYNAFLLVKNIQKQLVLEKTPFEIICFDDSKLHKAFNNHVMERRSVLIFDLARPAHLPRGTAKKGHTNQLDNFIAYFR